MPEFTSDLDLTACIAFFAVSAFGLAGFVSVVWGRQQIDDVAESVDCPFESSTIGAADA
jgi:hypothetical protein